MTAPAVTYEIAARLDTERHRLDGWMTLYYKSGADRSLSAINLHTYPNAFSHPNTIYAREAARQGEDYALRYAKPEDRGWMVIDSVSADGEAAAIAMNETLARVDLPTPLAPGKSVIVRLHFQVQVPIHFDRFGRTGDSYSIAQWYPKVVVYDDQGWHLDPFHYLAEFYGEFATYDVYLTLPDGHWVGATGSLQSARNGDNEIPLFASETPRDSVTVSLAVALADSLAGRWPAGGLRVETDITTAPERGPVELEIPQGAPVALRVPRGAPVHYRYLWGASETESGDEADEDGRPGPLRLIQAAGDTTITDTLRALAPVASPADTVLPSLKTLHFHAERVHDFAWVASPDFVRSDSTWSGVAVRVLVWREDETKWWDVKGQVVDAMRDYTDRVGPYLWPSFTLAEAFSGGGAMEYPMLVMTEPDLYDPLSHRLHDTNAHELGHQWFYGMLGSDERAHPWIDEGFTQNLEQIYIDAKYPDGLFRYVKRAPWVGRYGARDANELDYLARAWARDEQPISTPAEGYHGYRAYATASYTKPASMLFTLRGILGDSLFTAFLREYDRRNRLRHPGPDDVERALREVTGRDFSDYLSSWIDTLDRPSFAMGSIQREQVGNRHRSTLTVRRLERMSFPIKVEARFADGSRQERLVSTAARESEVVFESAARLTGATIDPRHEMVEVNRLDNATGPFPPMRLRLLWGFPSAEAIGVDVGPTLWHGEAEGVRIGAWLRGTYLPSQDFPDGVLGFEGGLSYGTRNESVAYRAGAWKRVERFGARGRVKTLIARDAGLFRAGLELGNRFTAPSRRHPYRSWTASIEYRDRDELDPVDPRYWDLGRWLEEGLSLELETLGPRHDESAKLSYRHGEAVDEDGSPRRFDWVALTFIQSLTLPPADLALSWRLAAAAASDDVPTERRLDIAQASRLWALPYFYANDRGPLRETEHFLVPGGGGVRGYAERAILGRRLLAANVELAHAAYPIFVFGDVGQVGPTDGPAVTGGLVGRTLSDAGFGLRYGPLEVAFPVWLSHPETEESPWRFRWNFSIGPISIPIE